MPDISSVLRSLGEDGSISQVANSPRLSFLDANDQVLVGAQLLPEIAQPLNRYDEEDFVLIDMIADDTDRYSPVKFKGEGIEVSSFEVVLGESSLGKQLSPATYDALVRLALEGSQLSIEQMSQNVLDFVGSLTRGLAARNEVQRWAAIVDGSVVRVINGASQTISYPSATGQRTTLANAWSADTYDPFDDFIAAQQYGSNLGYGDVSRIITSRKNINILARNENMIKRSQGISPTESTYTGVASPGRLNGYLATEGFPAIETYEARYTEQDGRNRVRQRYLPEDAIVFVFGTGAVNEEALRLAEEDGRPYIPTDAPGSLGYTGLGTVSGHSSPGRQVYLNPYLDTVRPHVTGEAAQTSLPVLREPNAVLVYSSVR